MDIKVGVKMDKHGYKEYLSKVLDLGGEYKEDDNDRQLDLFDVSK